MAWGQLLLHPVQSGAAMGGGDPYYLSVKNLFFWHVLQLKHLQLIYGEREGNEWM